MLNYIGIGDLAVFLQVDESALTTALADLAVAAAQQKVRKYLAQEITFHADDVEYLDGNGRKKIRLRQRPVREVTLVEEAEGDPTWVALAADAYTVRGTVLIRWDGDVWAHGEANLRVTYDHGYDIGDFDSDTTDSDYDPPHVPADISLVTLTLARRMYENMGAAAQAGELGNVKQETIGAYSYTLSAAAEAAAGVQLVKAEMSVLDAYKMRGAG